MNNTILQSALNYAERGFSIIPVQPNKKPFLKWESYQKTKAKAEEIKLWFTKWPDAMIGIVTGEISNLFVIDCDTKDGYETIQRLIPDSLIFPLARTPRGGWHLYFLYPGNLTIAAGIMPGVDIRGEGGYIIAPPSINSDKKAYEWQLSLSDVALAPMPCELTRALYNNKKNNIYREHDDNLTTMFADGRRDNDLFHVANILTKGGMPANEIEQVLEKLILSWGEKPDTSWIRAKIESAFKRSERAENNLAADVREWVLSSNGVFLSSDVAKELGLSSLSSRLVMQNVSKILSRLCDPPNPLIERYGNKRGCYRKIENEVEPLDWQNVEINPLNLIWPFGIHNLVNLFPGNIGVIAGFPNSGKTAFIHNFIRLNQNNHNIHLFSSEGGPEELKMRLSKFDCPLSEWKFKAWERSNNFADVIKPDAVNIIDYLEIHDDFYKVGGMIKAISDKLKTGFALIAIQKNGGRDEGLGGARGLEKPRLYMAMDSGRLKIVKAKSWVDSHNNPNGQSIKFKIVDGCKFVIESRWERSE